MVNRIGKLSVAKATETEERPGRIDRETFCRVWEGGNSVAEIARKLQMKEDTCMSRASAYRKEGVKLKYFDRGRPKKAVKARRAEVAKLNAMLDGVNRQEVSLIDCVREIVAGIEGVGVGA